MTHEETNLMMEGLGVPGVIPHPLTFYISKTVKVPTPKPYIFLLLMNSQI